MTQPVSGQLTPAQSAYLIQHLIIPSDGTGGWSQVGSGQLDATQAAAWIQAQEADALALGIVPFVTPAAPAAAAAAAAPAIATAAAVEAAPAAPADPADSGALLPPGV